MELGEGRTHYWPGIKRLQIRLIQERQSLQPKVKNIIATLEKSKLMARMAEDLEKKQIALKTNHTTLLRPSMYAQARQHLSKRVCRCQAWADSLDTPDHIEGHHYLRIAVKKLRYSLELFSPLLEGQLDAYIKQIKPLQTLLGDIHDCDVWGEQINDFISREYERTVDYFGYDGPFRQLRPGLEYLQQHWAHQRRALFQDVVTYWRVLSEDRFWESLVLLLDEFEEKTPGPKKRGRQDSDDVCSRGQL